MPVEGGRAREAPPGAVMKFGPDQAAVREIVRGVDPVAWAYVGLAGQGEDERELRWRKVAESLERDGAPAEPVATMAARFAAAPQGPLTIAMFASADGTLVHGQLLSQMDVPDRAGYCAPPAVRPVLRWAQERPPSVLVVTDRTGADITVGAGGDEPVRAVSIAGPDDEIERNAPGGTAQPRYQRRAEDSWKHNAVRVAEEVVARIAEVGAQVLVLSGDVRAVQLLTERLPTEPVVVVKHISGSRAADGSQPERRIQVEQALREASEAQNALLLELFQSNLNAGGRSVEGWAHTIDALAAGRVAALLIASAADDDRVVWFGRGATELYRDHDAALLSGTPVTSGRWADAAVRAALLSGAHVRVISADAPGVPREGIGAVCRFGSAP